MAAMRRNPSPSGEPLPLARARALPLARHGLAGPGHRGVDAALAATVGVYGAAPTCHLSLAARVPRYRLGHLDRALGPRRAAVRLRCMRQSVYVVRAADAAMVAAATGAGEKAFARLVRLSGLGPPAFAALARRIEAALAGRAPMTVAELRARLGQVPGRPEALAYAVALMARQGRLVRAEVRGAWTSDLHAYARWEDWLGQPLARLPPAAARADLARRYLRAFGPATSEDLRWWAGWTAAEAKAALAALGDEVAPLLLDQGGRAPRPALLLARDRAALDRADPAAAEGAALLPVWDAYVMGYRDRARLVAPGDAARVVDPRGNATSVLLLDGVAAGVWELDGGYQPPGGKLVLRVAPFRRLPRRRWREVEEAAARLAVAVGAEGARVARAGPPRPLAQGARNAFLAPLRLGAGARRP